MTIQTQRTQLLAGAYRCNITPPIGMPIEGSFHLIRADEILDELYASALVLDDGQNEIALVSVDACQIPEQLHAQIGAEITKLTGIPRARQMVVSTHTHNGPTVGGVVVEDKDVWWDYVEHFKRQIASAVFMAQKRKQPARVGAATGANPRHVFNRRLRHPDGDIIMNWFNKGVLKECVPSGPVDPALGVIKVVRPDGTPLAFVVSYALHNNAASGAPHRTAISADFSGAMSDALRRTYASDVITLFLPGAMGDINWINYADPTQDYNIIYQQIGNSLAATVMQLDQDMAYEMQPRLQMHQRLLKIAERPWEDTWLWDYRVFQLETPRNTSPSNPFYQAHLLWLEAGSPPLPTHELDMRVLAIGDNIAIASNPSEFFVELGMQVKAASPFKHTLMSTLTNGNAGYVPTRQAFVDGGYEVKKYPAGSFLAIEAGEQMVEASIRLLLEAKSK